MASWSGRWATQLRHGAAVVPWVARDAVPRLSRALAPTWIALALAVVEIDAVTDWTATRSALRLLHPVQRFALVGLAVAAGVASGVVPLRRTLRAPQDRWRWRLPLGPLGGAVALAPAWGLAVAPLTGPGWLLDRPFALPVVAVAPALAGAAGHRGVALASLVLGAVAAAVGEVPGVAVGLAGVVVGAATMAASPPEGHPVPRRSWALPSWGPVDALVRRDLLALWRLRPGAVVAALLVPGPAFAVQSTAVANLPLVGEGAVHGGLVVLTLAGSVGAGAVLALPVLLGSALDPRRAPVGAAGRAALLTGVGALLVAPSAWGVYLGGSGAPGRLLLHTLALATGAAWFAVGVGRRTDADQASYLWWLLLLGGLAFAPAPWGPVGVALAGALAGWGTARTLAGARRLPCS